MTMKSTLKQGKSWLQLASTMAQTTEIISKLGVLQYQNWIHRTVTIEVAQHRGGAIGPHPDVLAIQGIGDRAVRELLDIYEKNFSLNPSPNDRRWRIEHCQVIHPDDLLRFAKLKVIASIRGVFATSDGPWVVKRLGEKRARERGYLYRTLMDSGVTVINGTDPPVEGISPIENFYRSITREMDNGELFFPEQRLTRQQALETYTVNNAFAAFEENIKGSLIPGKLADITVLSQDIMTVPEQEIPNTKVDMSIVGGEVRFERE